MQLKCILQRQTQSVSCYNFQTEIKNYLHQILVSNQALAGAFLKDSPGSIGLCPDMT